MIGSWLVVGIGVSFAPSILPSVSQTITPFSLQSPYILGNDEGVLTGLFNINSNSIAFGVGLSGSNVLMGYGRGLFGDPNLSGYVTYGFDISASAYTGLSIPLPFSRKIPA
jgi:hypothetical protein